MTTIISKNEAETRAFGKKMALGLKPGDILCLSGDLGAGKTTLVKGIAEGLGIDPKTIKSPTFQLCRLYQTKKFSLYHCDFYRNATITNHLHDELEDMFLDRNAVVILEWPEKIEQLLPKKRIILNIEYGTDEERILTITNHE